VHVPVLLVVLLVVRGADCQVLDLNEPPRNWSTGWCGRFPGNSPVPRTRCPDKVTELAADWFARPRVREQNWHRPATSSGARAPAQYRQDLLVTGLGEVAVTAAHRTETSPGDHPHHLVGIAVGMQRGRQLRGAHREANTSRRGAPARSSPNAARTVAPVANPSSMSSTSRPATGNPSGHRGTAAPRKRRLSGERHVEALGGEAGEGGADVEG
jgi:hypothetical protein